MVCQHQKPQITLLAQVLLYRCLHWESWKWNYSCNARSIIRFLEFSLVLDFIWLILKFFWSIIMSMYIGMVILLILNLPLIPYIARILAVPKNYLIPLILFFSVTGIYVMSFNNFVYLSNDWDCCGCNIFKIIWFSYAPVNFGFCTRWAHGGEFETVFIIKQWFMGIFMG